MPLENLPTLFGYAGAAISIVVVVAVVSSRRKANTQDKKLAEAHAERLKNNKLHAKRQAAQRATVTTVTPKQVEPVFKPSHSEPQQPLPHTNGKPQTRKAQRAAAHQNRKKEHSK